MTVPIRYRPQIFNFIYHIYIYIWREGSFPTGAFPTVGNSASRILVRRNMHIYICYFSDIYIIYYVYKFIFVHIVQMMESPRKVFSVQHSLK